MEIKIPEIEPLEYDGKDVFTTRQLAALFGCKPYSITVHFNENRDLFEVGTDYYFVEGDAVRELKKAVRREVIAGNYPEIGSLHTFANHTYLWAKDGAIKISKLINTEVARLVCMHFYQPITSNLPDNLRPNNCLTFEQFKFLIENCTDDNLKNELIKAAFKLCSNLD